MATLNYNISASIVGDGFETDSLFQFFYDNCLEADNLASNTSGDNTFNKTQITSGVTLVVPDSAEFLYLVPLSNDCPLGCNYDYKITLSGYIPPTPTPTVTPTVTPTLTPTNTPSVTPTNSAAAAAPIRTFGTNTVVHVSGDLTISWSSSIPIYDRYTLASGLANYLANTTVSQTTNPSTPNTKDLDTSFDIYDGNDPVLSTVIYDINKLVGAKVWWYSDSSQTYVKVTGISFGDPLGTGSSYGPDIIGYLKV